ncbi:MAG TPA: hypothetical protein VHE78_11610 [Gemmatimonadaceae bacterium]|nr:hypothetical protein [Gemmatimonadaceae bacterium]
MTNPAPHTAEEASPAELKRGSIRLLVMLLALALLVVPLIRELPLGQTTRTGILAWLLVALAFYWMYAGLGYKALLLVQLLLFSAAAALLTTKAGLVLVGIDRLSILRRSAKDLILLGAACAAVNMVMMLVGVARRKDLARGGTAK